MIRYEVDGYYDPDLLALLFESPSTDRLEAALMVVCLCGHTRGDHFAVGGSLGSFGGSACGECGNCSAFRAAS